MPALQERQAEIHAQLEEAGRLDEPTAFADVCIRPFAEYLAAGPSARAWLVIASELAAHPRTDVEAVSTHAAPATVDVGSRLYNRLVVDADPAVVVNRIRTISEAALHVVADRARLEADPKRTRDALPLADVADDLVQTMTAALTAPFPPREAGSGGAIAPPGARERGQDDRFLAR